MRYEKPTIKTTKAITLQERYLYEGIADDGSNVVSSAGIKTYRSAKSAAKAWAKAMIEKWRWDYYENNGRRDFPHITVSNIREAKYYRRALPVFEKIFNSF